jgi:hypothetical protein
MLLNNRLASIRCSSHQSVSCANDLSSVFPSSIECCADSSTTSVAALQHFQMRVTQRLHRYRSLKRQWQQVTTSIGHRSSPLSIRPPTLPSTGVVSLVQHATRSRTIGQSNVSTDDKTYSLSDVLNATSTAPIRDEQLISSVELDPLHTRIQQDLMKLRRFMKIKQNKNASPPMEADRTALRAPVSSREPVVRVFASTRRVSNGLCTCPCCYS